MTDIPMHIQFALISHTNSGKTTLARTLLGEDIGEVRDAAHVTAIAESHVLQTSAAGDTLRLWDTPGFGDSVRLQKRLAMSGNPVGWFLREVVDRYRERPFWLSQQAMRTARDEADVVLYLVNASEDPADAGYLAAEMRILGWLEKPVIVLLNQMGAPRPLAYERAEQARWQRHLEQYPVVRGVLALDAFARCWVHEHVFYEAVGALVPAAKQDAYARVFAAGEAARRKRFDEAMQLTANQLVAAIQDSELVEREDRTLFKSALKVVGLSIDREQKRQDRAMNLLAERLNLGVARTTVQLLMLHKLRSSHAAQVNERVRDNFTLRAPIDKTQASLLGALVSGAATGLSADLLAGGMTMGAGAVVGSVVGALTFAGVAWGFNACGDCEEPDMRFSDDFLRTLLVGSLLRYLAVAHFGRGRGDFIESEAPVFWQNEVEQAVAQHGPALMSMFHAVREEANRDTARAAAAVLIAQIAAQILLALYPGATFLQHDARQALHS